MNNNKMQNVISCSCDWCVKGFYEDSKINGWQIRGVPCYFLFIFFHRTACSCTFGILFGISAVEGCICKFALHMIIVVFFTNTVLISDGHTEKVIIIISPTFVYMR